MRLLLGSALLMASGAVACGGDDEGRTGTSSPEPPSSSEPPSPDVSEPLPRPKPTVPLTVPPPPVKPQSNPDREAP